MDFKNTAISGVKWTTASTFITALVAVLRLSVLARFLSKEDFGVVAIITLVLGLTQTFADLGFSSAIMYRQDLTRRDFSSLYWIQLIFFSVIYIAISLCSGVISVFYEAPSLTYLLPLALLDLIFYGIGRLYDTILQKEFQFKVIAIRNIVCALVSLIVAIVLAVLGFGIYSLVLSTLFQTLVNNVWNALAGQKYCRIQCTITLRSTMPLVRIGMYQTGTQIVDNLSNRLDVLIIGKLLGIEMLGIYSLAKELVMRVVYLVNTIANRVTLPYFSKMQHDDAGLRRNYCRVIQILSSVNFPISLLICLLSNSLVYIFYGYKYLEAAPLISIFSIWSLFICIGNPVGNIVIAKGRTDLSLKYVILRVLLTVPVIGITSLCSLTYVAWGQVVMAVILFLLAYRMMIYKLIRLPFLEYIRSFYHTGLIFLVVCACLYFPIHSNVVGIESPLIQLLVYSTISVVFYFTLLLIFFKSRTLNMIKHLKSCRN